MPFRASAMALSSSFWVILLFVTSRSNLVEAFFVVTLRRLKKAMPSAFAISATDSSSFLVKRSAAFLVEEL